eukprot:TRINITY_DN9316_c0_g1_i2.p1 TRINITY_DN9316_c0_g1~~TRINITY_DN9316_c0_g1_i2.p1  ORF type:complete len:270 (+),score=53.94 TRINITY_DN9316_c0_g1_i2:112-921(+)
MMNADIIKELHDHHHGKLSYYLTKVDSMQEQTDRENVLVQITLSLAHCVHDYGFQLKSICIPKDENEIPYPPNAHQEARKLIKSKGNRIFEMDDDINKGRELMAQSAIKRLAEDSQKLHAFTKKLLVENEFRSAENWGSFFLGYGVLILAIMLPFCVGFLMSGQRIKALRAFVPNSFICLMIFDMISEVAVVLSNIFSQWAGYVYISTFVISVMLLLFSKYQRRYSATLDANVAQRLEENMALMSGLLKVAEDYRGQYIRIFQSSGTSA